MARRDLRETPLTGSACRLEFVRRVGVRMHEGNGYGPDSSGVSRLERRADRVEVELSFNHDVGPYAFRHFGHARVEHRRLLDAAGEDFGARLIADLERVAESVADDEQHRVALTLQQRVGGDGRAHSDACDQMRWQRTPARRAE